KRRHEALDEAKQLARRSQSIEIGVPIAQVDRPVEIDVDGRPFYPGRHGIFSAGTTGNRSGTGLPCRFWIVSCPVGGIIETEVEASAPVGGPPMPVSSHSQLHRQLVRVSRRLFGQSLLDALIWCWAGALLLGTAWCLAEPHVTAA